MQKPGYQRLKSSCNSLLGIVAKNTLDGMETMRMIQKGQVRYIGKDILKQNQFVRSLFGLAA